MGLGLWQRDKKKTNTVEGAVQMILASPPVLITPNFDNLEEIMHKLFKHSSR
jgi:hypothetical protein